MKRILTRTLTVLLALTLLVAPTVATAQPAHYGTDTTIGTQAAWCYNWKYLGYENGLYHRYLPANSSGNRTCTMSVGSQSNSVKALQRSLRYCYGRNISIDGQFGNGTRSALIYAQGQAGAGADGIFGPDTSYKLRWPKFDIDGYFVSCARVWYSEFD